MQSGAAKLLFSYRAEQSAGSREEISGSFFLYLRESDY